MTPNEAQKLLKRFDDEITSHRQQIAAHQVHIARLEDSRRLIMGLAEADQMHAQAEPVGTPALSNGSHAKPMLIVRKTTQDTPPPVEKAPRKGPRKSKDGSKRAAWRERVKKFFDEPDTEPMKAAELANYFGLAASSKDKDRKDLANALYYMAQAGTLQKDGEGRYFAPTRQ